MAAIRADLARLDGRPAPDALVGMGGAMTNLTAVSLGLEAYDPTVDGVVLHVDEVDRQIELYRTRDVAARRTIVGLQPQRRRRHPRGACIVRTVMGLLGQQSVTVSDRGPLRCTALLLRGVFGRHHRNRADHADDIHEVRVAADGTCALRGSTNAVPAIEIVVRHVSRTSESGSVSISASLSARFVAAKPTYW